MAELQNFIHKADRSLSEFEFLPNPNDKNSPKLGTGSFAEVRLVKEKATQNLYAIKIANVCLSKASSSEFYAIRNEIKIHKKLNHENVIKFYGYIYEPTRVCLVLEYAENGNLYNYLYKKKLLSENEAFRFFYQTCQAIQYIHQKDIMHRDIKPENLLLDKNFNIKLCDFGWSAFSLYEKRTTFCGTYEYMAPEIVAKKSYDYRIDIWSLGILLYELIHREAPYRGRTLPEISASLQKNQIRFSSSTPSGAKDLILRLLKFDPSERLQLEEVFAHPWIQKFLIREKQAAACVSPKQKFFRTKSHNKELLASKENLMLKEQEVMNELPLPVRPKKEILSPQYFKFKDMPVIAPGVPKAKDYNNAMAKEESHQNKLNATTRINDDKKDMRVLKERNGDGNQYMIEENGKMKPRNKSSPTFAKKLKREWPSREKELLGRTMRPKENINPSALSPAMTSKLTDVLTGILAHKTMHKRSKDARDNMMLTSRSPFTAKKLQIGGETNISKPVHEGHQTTVGHLYKQDSALSKYLPSACSPLDIPLTPTNLKMLQNPAFKRNRPYKDLSSEFKKEMYTIKVNNKAKPAQSPRPSTMNSTRSRLDNQRSELPTQPTEADSNSRRSQDVDGAWLDIKKSDEVFAFAIPFNQFHKGSNFNRKLVLKMNHNGQNAKTDGRQAVNA